MRKSAIAAIILAMVGSATAADANERWSSRGSGGFQEIAFTLPEVDGTRLSDDPLVCMALTLYWEGRGETRTGQKAVGHVVLNRARAAGYPDDICAVVTQNGPAAPCQFSWFCDGRSDLPTDRAAWARAVEIAKDVMRNPYDDPTHGALYFHRKDLRPSWARAKAGPPKTLGGHVFFRLASS